MSDVIVSSESSDLDTPQFLEDLVPAGEKTALLFHITYHCLAKFPELERIIRANAVEVQMAFNSSEALLWECISTSDNMVSVLFPMLKAAVQKGNALLAVKYLEKARGWIKDIIRDVDQMVDEYGKLTLSVASATSDVNTVKVQTDQKIKQLTKELKALKDNVAGLQSKEKTKQSELDENEKKIEAATNDLQKAVDDIAARNRKFGIVAAVVPFIGFIIDAAQRSINSSEDRGRLTVAQDKIRGLRDERANISRQLGRVQTELMHWQFQLSKSSIELGAVPDPVHLPEVQQNLTRIQQILLQLKSFWEKIDVLVKNLEQKTFAGEEMLEFIEDSKEEFLQSISLAKEAWIKFKNGCNKSVIIFTLKNKDAYKFLEINPSTLTPEEWEKQYNDLKTSLETFYQTVTDPAIEGSPENADPAIEGSPENADPAVEGSPEQAGAE